MHNETEIVIVHCGNIGIMEKNRESTVVYWSNYQDNGKENGNYYIYPYIYTHPVII